MVEKRDVKLDLFALALLALVVFLALSLFSYHRSDPSLGKRSGVLVYPASAEIQNVCGRGGAWVADLLLRLAGVGAYYLVISLAILDTLLLMRRPIDQHLVRLTGWLLSFAGPGLTLLTKPLSVIAPSPSLCTGSDPSANVGSSLTAFTLTMKV